MTGIVSLLNGNKREGNYHALIEEINDRYEKFIKPEKHQDTYLLMNYFQEILINQSANPNLTYRPIIICSKCTEENGVRIEGNLEYHYSKNKY